MNTRKIHQFSFATSVGSGVTNSLFYTQKLLRELGFESEIFSTGIADGLRERIRNADALRLDSDALILIHHCLGYDNTDWLFSLPNPKVMVYHNITPPSLLPANSEIGGYAALGRIQLAEWCSNFIGAIGDSNLNTLELQENGYRNTRTIPMLVDLEKNVGVHLTPDISRQWEYLQDSYNLLFVGRICENKNQAELIEVLSRLRSMSGHRVRLILAGEVTSGEYANFLHKEVNRWGVSDEVVFTGKLDEESLLALYRNADTFVCLSEHEGFGMPLIEAMQYGLPVVARQSSSIGDTLGGAGWLLDATADSYQVAGALWTLMEEPALRRNLLRSQAERLGYFSRAEIKERLRAFLTDLQIVAPQGITSPTTSARPMWQVEGPFDSSYSLAIVNRELARAIQNEGVTVGLRSHEGHGDFSVNSEFLAENVDCAEMMARSLGELGSDRYPDVAMRFCYPPYANDMPAALRVMHSYGWEETGFPQAYVEEFNRRLDLITVLSKSVAKTLRDSGVRIPIVVTGAGVNHLLGSKPAALSNTFTDSLKRFCFLHISSGFPRKGLDVLLRSYGQAFTASDEVSLIIKTFPNPHNQLVEQLAQLQRERADFPHVVLINEEWPQERIVALYKVANALVAPSRGEGFGLPLAEAMLFDVPVITTGWGGQTDFCNQHTSWLCEYQFAKAETHMGLTHTLWAEPDADHLAFLMREVSIAPPVFLKAKTDAAKKLVQQRFTWKETAQRTITAVQAIRAQTCLRKQPKIAWISTWNARCGIANYSHFLSKAFPEDRLLVLANHIPERMELDQSNVIRCWNAEQEENFDLVSQNIFDEGVQAVVLQYNFGFASLKNLAEFLRNLREHDIKVYVFFHSTAVVKINGHEVSLGSIRTTLSQAAGLFVHSVEDVNRLKAWDLIDNVVYFPHGVSAPATPKIEKLPFFAGKKTIASYGFLLPHKGISCLIQAFADLDHTREDYQLLLVNSLYPNPISQDEHEDCLELISELGIEHKVKFITDFLSDDETLALLRNADLIVFPYQQTQESSSAAVRVGLSTGKPVAVTPLRIFDDVREAVHVLSGTDSSAISTGITQLLSQHVVDHERQKNVQAWFAERDWLTLSTRLLNIIDGGENAHIEV